MSWQEINDTRLAHSRLSGECRFNLGAEFFVIQLESYWGRLMAEEGKQGTNLANGGVVLMALLATGALVFHKEAPLTGSRPPVAESSIRERVEAQTVDARLWQDPFAAIGKAVDKLAPDKHGQQCAGLSSTDKFCHSPITQNDQGALVLGVTLSVAPYAEDFEQRRRTRYAVLSGLERAGFVPRDARHIGYFWLLQEMASAEAPQAGLPANFSLHPPFFVQPAQAFGQVSKSIGASSAEPGQSVPYEWFEEAAGPTLPGKQTPKKILVLWLEEETLKHHPFRKITALKSFLQLQENQKLKIIGPYSSDILRDMVKEGCSFDKTKDCGVLQDVVFYPYGASVPDRQILGDAGKTVEEYFNDVHLHVQRMIGTDDSLAKSLKAELDLRNVKVGSGLGEGELALISEWDTFYGQTLPKAVEDIFGADKCNSRSTCSWIHKLTYLRGLDGLTPMTGGTDEKKPDKPAEQSGKQEGAAAFFKTSTDANTMDRPVGQGQFDYLRRMSKDLHKTDDELRKDGRRIKAIGVLGSDVFDKLLVLRALRPEFPEALFFTTDFDESYTIDSELPWTRNLIIASSFGPALNDEIQGGIPSFRSGYQTAVFLAALTAIGDSSRDWETPPPVETSIAKQLKSPRIFEISRGGNALAFGQRKSAPAFLPETPEPKQEDCPGCQDKVALNGDGSLMTGRSEAGGSAQVANSGCDTSPRPWYCGTTQIQPGNEELFPTFDETGRKLLVSGLAGGALLALTLLLLRKVPKAAIVEVWLAAAGLGIGAWTAAHWVEFAQVVTSHGEGEPIALLDGVSVWPTVFLRILGILLSLYFIWRAQHSLYKNLVAIAADMKLPLSGESVPTAGPVPSRGW